MVCTCFEFAKRGVCRLSKDENWAKVIGESVGSAFPRVLKWNWDDETPSRGLPVARGLRELQKCNGM